MANSLPQSSRHFTYFWAPQDMPCDNWRRSFSTEDIPHQTSSRSWAGQFTEKFNKGAWSVEVLCRSVRKTYKAKKKMDKDTVYYSWNSSVLSSFWFTCFLSLSVCYLIYLWKKNLKEHGKSSSSKVPDTSHISELLKICHLIIADEAFPLKTYLMRPHPVHELDSSLKKFQQLL